MTLFPVNPALLPALGTGILRCQQTAANSLFLAEKDTLAKMESFTMDDAAPSFCIGHHESNRSYAVTSDVVRKAHEANVRLFPAVALYCDVN